jgi:methionyl-tRNA formyltransferase
VPSLAALRESGFEVAAVVTNPDRPAGRGRVPRPPPVKVRAEAAGIDVLQPAGAREHGLAERLTRIDPVVAVVVAYGRILPEALLEIPRFGFVNVHFSLLPAYRGAAPVQRALIDGRDETGVSIMVLSAGMDEGPVLTSRPVPVEDEDTAATLGSRLAEAGAALLPPSLRAYVAGEVVPRPQDHSRATYAPKVSAEEARIEWRRPAETVRNLVRGCNPEPGAWTTLRATRVRVLEVSPAPGARVLAPGELRFERELLVGSSDGLLALDRIQLAGGRPMSGPEAARGLRLEPGERFE